MNLQYRIIQDAVRDTSMFTFAIKHGLFVLELNPEHLFYRKVYKSLVENETKENKELRGQLDLLILSAARAEAAATRETQRDTLAQSRKVWSNNVAAFLNR